MGHLKIHGYGLATLLSPRSSTRSWIDASPALEGCSNLGRDRYRSGGRN